MRGGSAVQLQSDADYWEYQLFRNSSSVQVYICAVFPLKVTVSPDVDIYFVPQPM